MICVELKRRQLNLGQYDHMMSIRVVDSIAYRPLKRLHRLGLENYLKCAFRLRLNYLRQRSGLRKLGTIILFVVVNLINLVNFNTSYVQQQQHVIPLSRRVLVDRAY